MRNRKRKMRKSSVAIATALLTATLSLTAYGATMSFSKYVDLNDTGWQTCSGVATKQVGTQDAYVSITYSRWSNCYTSFQIISATSSQQTPVSAIVRLPNVVGTRGYIAYNDNIVPYSGSVKLQVKPDGSWEGSGIIEGEWAANVSYGTGTGSTTN